MDFKQGCEAIEIITHARGLLERTRGVLIDKYPLLRGEIFQLVSRIDVWIELINKKGLAITGRDTGDETQDDYIPSPWRVDYENRNG